MESLLRIMNVWYSNTWKPIKISSKVYSKYLQVKLRAMRREFDQWGCIVVSNDCLDTDEVVDLLMRAHSWGCGPLFRNILVWKYWNLDEQSLADGPGSQKTSQLQITEVSTSGIKLF